MHVHTSYKVSYKNKKTIRNCAKNILEENKENMGTLKTQRIICITEKKETYKHTNTQTYERNSKSHT